MPNVRKTVKPLLESTIQKKITKKLQLHGWLVCKIIQCTLNGFPDLMCLKDGGVVFIEVKSSTGKPSPLQLYRHQQLKEYNFTTLIINDVQQLPEFMLYRS